MIWPQPHPKFVMLFYRKHINLSVNVCLIPCCKLEINDKYVESLGFDTNICNLKNVSLVLPANMSSAARDALY